jgi:hypothetical protein
MSLPLPDFSKNVLRAALAAFSKEVCSSETYLADLKTGKSTLDDFQKLSVQL